MQADSKQDSGDLAAEELYREADHGFFPELVRIVISLSALGNALHASRHGSAKPFESQQVMVIEGKPDAGAIEIHFSLGAYLSTVDQSDRTAATLFEGC